QKRWADESGAMRTGLLCRRSRFRMPFRSQYRNTDLGLLGNMAAKRGKAHHALRPEAIGELVDQLRGVAMGIGTQPGSQGRLRRIELLEACGLECQHIDAEPGIN